MSRRRDEPENPPSQLFGLEDTSPYIKLILFHAKYVEIEVQRADNDRNYNLFMYLTVFLVVKSTELSKFNAKTAT